MSTPVKVTVTGAAGQIGYALLFRIASGQMLGSDQPVILQLLELPLDKAQAALKGVMMELEDCAFPLLAGMSGGADAKTAFKDTNNLAFTKYINDRTRAPLGRRYFLVTEAGRITSVRAQLPTQRARDSFEVLDTTSNKFSLAAFWL